MSGIRTYGYDAVDNQITATDRNGRTTNYAYDNLDRITSELWVGNGKSFTYTYDKNSNLLTANDGNIGYGYSYDSRDWLTQVDRTSNNNPIVSFKYDYDAIGNITKADELIGNSLTATTLYEYNDPRHLNTAIVQTGTNLAAKRVEFSYDQFGLTTGIARYQDNQLAVTTTNTYDSYGRLTGIEQRNSGGVIGSSTYNLDIQSRLNGETKDGANRQFNYDDTDQVKTVTGSNSEAYTYDKNGNRTNGGYVTGTGNRLLSDGTYDYDYDPEGNRTKQTYITDNSSDEYSWDYRNRLVAVVSKNAAGVVSQTVGYEYDVDDQRVRKSVNGVVENYYLDRNQIAFVTDGNGVQTFHYLYGLDVDQVLAQDSPTGMVWSLADRQGSIDMLTDGSGNVVDKRTFDSFGKLLTQTNPSVQFRYGYTGREYDAETGLSYYRARYYDSNVGRFISVDPIGFGGGDTNLYRYVGNNTTMYTDPSGEVPLPSWNDIKQGAANLSNTAQDYAYGGLVNTDKFVAGAADLWTGGYTTKLRNEVYGDKVEGQHDGWQFRAGQVAGFGVSAALGFKTPNALGGISAVERVAQGYTVVQAGIGAYNTTTKIQNGQMDWCNPWSYLEVAGSYAPLIGAAAKQSGLADKAAAVGGDLLNAAGQKASDYLRQRAIQQAKDRLNGWTSETGAIDPRFLGADLIVNALEAKIVKYDILNKKYKQTLAAAGTDIVGLENEVFEGLSPQIRNQSGLPSLDVIAPNRATKSPYKNEAFTRHAEEDIFAQVEKKVIAGNISSKDLTGKTLFIHISNPNGVCNKCLVDLITPSPSGKIGVVKDFSLKYPELTIEISAKGGNAHVNHPVLRIRGGKLVED